MISIYEITSAGNKRKSVDICVFLYLLDTSRLYYLTVRLSLKVSLDVSFAVASVQSLAGL